MFGIQHYVPVVKWKRGEKFALRELSDGVRRNVTPVVEFIPNAFGKSDLKVFGPAADIFEKLLADVKNCWGTSQFYLDLHLITPIIEVLGEIRCLQLIQQIANRLGLQIIYVTYFGSGNKFSEALREIYSESKSDVCVRLTSPNLATPSFNKHLTQLIESVGRIKQKTHLMVDYGYIGEHMPDLNLADRIIDGLSNYKEYIAISCSFPESLSGYAKNKQYEHPRNDWIGWRDYVSVNSNKKRRQPTFGDYTIRHPSLPQLPDFPNTSASIRYTHDDYWVIMRGEGLRNKKGPKFKQFPAQASLLCGRDEFRGAEFSSGDNYFYDLSLRVGQSRGSPETMIRAGVNHHITLVVHQLSNLSAN